MVTGHFIDLAVFLVKLKPPSLFLRTVIFDGERDDRTEAGERVEDVAALWNVGRTTLYRAIAR